MALDPEIAWHTIETELNEARTAKNECNEPAFVDFNVWLHKYINQPDEVCNDMRQLHANLCACLGVPRGEGIMAVVPNMPAKGRTEHAEVMLWSLGYSPDMFIRGPSGADNIMKNLEKQVRQGAETNKHPIEISPQMSPGLDIGGPIHPFHILTSVGNSQVTAAYLFVLLAIKHKWFNGVEEWGSVPEGMKCLANNLLKSLHLHATMTHHASLEELVSHSANAKIEASLRPRPTILNMSICFTKVIRQKKANGVVSRMSDAELILQQAKDHNKRTPVKRFHIKPEELKGLQTLAGMSERFKNRPLAQHLLINLRVHG